MYYNYCSVRHSSYHYSLNLDIPPHNHNLYCLFCRIISSTPAVCWKDTGGQNRTELATSYWAQWRGALCHILHTRRWHRTVNWHWEQPDPLQLDRTWEEQSVHQHFSADCQLRWELREECSNSTTRWVVHKKHHSKQHAYTYAGMYSLKCV